MVPKTTGSMISYPEAQGLIRKNIRTLPSEKVSLSESLKRVLAEDIYSDLDMPPFDKSAMDGFACRKADIKTPLLIRGTIYAGQEAHMKVNAGECVKIMTGAPVPEGADTVIMIEETSTVDQDHILYTGHYSKSNICLKGEDMRKGDRLLSQGTLIYPQHIAMMAATGHTHVLAYDLPKVAIVASGSELVEPSVKPQGGKIRNSNAYNLLAQLRQINIGADYKGIVSDQKHKLSDFLRKLIVNYDLILVTGGASQGEHDFVPVVLEELGLDLKFDRLAIQPGKPVSFAAGRNKFCFGLSGNPVSSFLQFELLVKPFLYLMMGHEFEPPVQLAPLFRSRKRKKADRMLYFPVIINVSGQAEEIPFNGSAHITGLNDADGFAIFPRDRLELTQGELVEVLRIRK